MRYWRVVGCVGGQPFSALTPYAMTSQQALQWASAYCFDWGSQITLYPV